MTINRMTNLIAVVGALMLALVMAASGQGQQGHGGPPPGGGFPGGPGPRDGLGPLARDLNLTEEQKAQVQKITDGFRESNKALHEQLRSLHESESDPFGAFDEAAVRAGAEARAKIEVELSVSRAKMMSQIGSVLTADQKAQLAAKRQQFERRPPPPPPSQ